MLTINTNTSSLMAQNALSSNQSSLSVSLQRLSTGLRINSAADDAAGYAISQRMTAQVNGLDQAVRNSNDGVSLSQTAGAGLSSIASSLQRMRELAVQSANDTNSSSDRSSLQAEVTQLQAEINRVATTTQFNGKNLLDGTFAGANFQVGANANQTIGVSISNAQASSVGSYTLDATGAATGNGVSVAAGTMNVASAAAAGAWGSNGTVTGKAISIIGPSSSGGAASVYTTTAAGETGEDVAAGINALSSATGVTATAITTATLSGLGSGNVSFSLANNEGGAGNNAVTINATVTSSDYSNLASAINAQTATTGVTAVFQNGKLTLSNAQGGDIAIKGFTTTSATTTASFQGVDTFTGNTTTAQTLTSGGTNSSTVGAAMKFSAAGAFTVQDAGSGVITSAATQTSSLQAVSSLDISSQTGATSALSIIDGALQMINNQQASLGAIQNRFNNTISNLQSTSQNLSSAQSRIQDTDFASETAKLSRAQILQQAGTAMLAQANQLPQQVLKLLQ